MVDEDRGGPGSWVVDRRTLVKGFGAGAVGLLVAACTPVHGSGPWPGPRPVTPPNDVTLLGLGQAPKFNNAPVGTVFTPNFYGLYSNGSQWDLTQRASWSSLGPGASSVSPMGNITIGAGHTVIRGVYGGFSEEYDIWDTSSPGTGTGPVRRIQVDPWRNGFLESSPTGPGGAQQTNFVAFAYHDDSSQFDNSADEDVTELSTWTSDNPTVATVSNTAGSRGLATAQGVAGTAKITATYTNVDGTFTDSGFWFLSDGLTVWISASSNPSYSLGGYLGFAEARDTDVAAFTETYVTPTAVWHTSNAAIATVAAGFITAVAPGTCNIWATYGAHTSNLLQINVT